MKKQLTYTQITRLFNVIKPDNGIKDAYFYSMEGADTTAIEVHFYGGKTEMVYPTRKFYNFIKNGFTLTREAK